jgi:phospholipase D-like protein
MLTVFAILWLVIWALTLFDLFRRKWSVLTKVLWALAMLIFPVVGVIAYLIVRPPAASDVNADAASRAAAEERATGRRVV